MSQLSLGSRTDSQDTQSNVEDLPLHLIVESQQLQTRLNKYKYEDFNPAHIPYYLQRRSINLIADYEEDLSNAAADEKPFPGDNCPGIDRAAKAPVSDVPCNNQEDKDEDGEEETDGDTDEEEQQEHPDQRNKAAQSEDLRALGARAQGRPFQEPASAPTTRQAVGSQAAGRAAEAPQPSNSALRVAPLVVQPGRRRRISRSDGRSQHRSPRLNGARSRVSRPPSIPRVCSKSSLHPLAEMSASFWMKKEKLPIIHARGDYPRGGGGVD